MAHCHSELLPIFSPVLHPCVNEVHLRSSQAAISRYKLGRSNCDTKQDVLNRSVHAFLSLNRGVGFGLRLTGTDPHVVTLML